MHIPSILIKYKFFVLASICVIFAIVIGFFVNKSHQTFGWNKQKATFLAKRALLDATQDDINQLANASSAEDAVNKLFTPPSANQIDQYQQGLHLLQEKKLTYKNDISYQNAFYTYQLVHDPDRLRRKIYYLWEDTFPVDASEKDDGITYQDVQNLDDILYTNALGNYLTIAKQMQTNYAMAVYLNLPDSNAKNPNENFARELMQLFLIGPYAPTDHNLSVQNYSDSDVNALAYILTGYHVKTTNHTIFYDPTDHYQPTKLFLGDQINDPQNMVDYIINKRKNQAGEFLANKLLHYYLSDNPTDDDVKAFANVIEDNNFEITPSLKWLFTSDIMYKPNYMNEERFKTPVEIVASFYTMLFGRDNYAVIPNNQILSDLDFTPYRPGSVFGRDGFKRNALFYSATIINRFIADTDKIIYEATEQEKKTFFTKLIPKNSTTFTQFLNMTLQNIYPNQTLPSTVVSSLIDYLSSSANGKKIVFNSQKNTYQNSKILGVLSLIFSQPEFLQISGSSQESSMQSIQETSNTNIPKLLVVRIKGGWDWQNLIANTKDSAYATNRKLMPLTDTNSTSLGDGYVLNNAAKTLLPLEQTHEITFINAVGLPNHSRAHDIASEQMETGLNPQFGILASVAQKNNNIKLISFTATPPIMFRSTQSLQIGSTNLTLYNESNKVTDATQKITTLKNIISYRLLPRIIAGYYQQALLLDSLSLQHKLDESKATGKQTNNEQQLSFLGDLLSQNIGNIFYMYADNSYDTHAQEDKKFNQQISTLFENLTTFYNAQKDKEKINIVVFSEFGRTDKVNGNHGTDHGTGGGMVIMSNTLHFPIMIGSLTPSKDTNNWTNVAVDARDVWSTIFNNLYGIEQTALFGRNTQLQSYPVTIQ